MYSVDRVKALLARSDSKLKEWSTNGELGVQIDKLEKEVFAEKEELEELMLQLKKRLEKIRNNLKR
jgi:hypothetical protein